MIFPEQEETWIIKNRLWSKLGTSPEWEVLTKNSWGEINVKATAPSPKFQYLLGQAATRIVLKLYGPKEWF